jgi:hypothetical protein
MRHGALRRLARYQSQHTISHRARARWGHGPARQAPPQRLPRRVVCAGHRGERWRGAWVAPESGAATSRGERSSETEQTPISGRDRHGNWRRASVEFLPSFPVREWPEMLGVGCLCRVAERRSPHLTRCSRRGASAACQRLTAGRRRYSRQSRPVSIARGPCAGGADADG